MIIKIRAFSNKDFKTTSRTIEQSNIRILHKVHDVSRMEYVFVLESTKEEICTFLETAYKNRVYLFTGEGV